MPNGTRSVPACCATQWRRVRLRGGRAQREALVDVMSELSKIDGPAGGRRDELRPGYPLRPRRRTADARTPYARSRPLSAGDGPLRVFALLPTLSRCSSTSVSRTRRRHRVMGRPGPADRSGPRRRVEAAQALATVPRHLPSWFGPTDMWLGWGRAVTPDCVTRWPPGSGRPDAHRPGGTVDPPDGGATGRSGRRAGRPVQSAATGSG